MGIAQAICAGHLHRRTHGAIRTDATCEKLRLSGSVLNPGRECGAVAGENHLRPADRLPPVDRHRLAKVRAAVLRESKPHHRSFFRGREPDQAEAFAFGIKARTINGASCYLPVVGMDYPTLRPLTCGKSHLSYVANVGRGVTAICGDEPGTEGSDRGWAARTNIWIEH